MARIRSIKPEYWDDRKLARLASRDARLLYIGLWNLSDEWQRLNGDPVWIKGQIFPYDDDIDADYISKLLAELENPQLGAVMAYEASGDPYLFLPKLGRHQRLEPEKVKSRLPAPPGPDGPDDPDPSSASANGTGSSASRADKSAQRADQSAYDAEGNALLYVAGGREHGAGSRGAHAGTRDAPHELPRDFTPTDSMLKWAEHKYPGLDLDFETDQFCHHYWSHGDRRKSWPDQWQKWMGDSWQRRKLSRAPTTQGGLATSDRKVVSGLALAAEYAEEERAVHLKELPS